MVPFGPKSKPQAILRIKGFVVDTWLSFSSLSVRLDVRTGAEIRELRAQICELSSRTGNRICPLRFDLQSAKKRERASEDTRPLETIKLPANESPNPKAGC